MAVDKLGRSYSLGVKGTDGKTMVFELPYTIEFDITRNAYSSANVAQFRLFNLSEKVRNNIRFNMLDCHNAYRAVTMTAGYGKNQAVVFSGSISQAWSVREGTDFITQIESFDAGYAISNAELSAVSMSPQKAGTPHYIVIQKMIDALKPYRIKTGLISDVYKTDTLKMKTSYNGNVWNELRKICKADGVFIDNGAVYAIDTLETVPNGYGIPVINAQSGLLGTPVRERTNIHFDIIFEPTLFIGMRVKLESSTAKVFSNPVNNTYKVMAVKHRGMISPSVCGEAITSGQYLIVGDLSGLTGLVGP